VLEYTGRGKSIIDVGLAQTRSPLNTTVHYFEIEIVDPGKSCYIAIGQTRRVSTDGLGMHIDTFITVLKIADGCMVLSRLK
jgi:hypothetical protein